MKNSLNTIASFLLCVICLVLLFGMSGCANIIPNLYTKSETPHVQNLGNVEFHTHRLAQELFTGFTADRQYRYAVAGFVPVTSMQLDMTQQGPLMLLGQQLEQGLMTEAVKYGLVTQDFKASNSIIMSESYDRALSRDLSHLSQLQNIDYYITGTITPQQNGAIVNARVINVRNKDVVAAATGYFPGDLFWETEQVVMRNGQLYRTEK
ncbi:FlgO family outer membrane protein [Glaciecola petra]|uniref:FlgO family outer membrane protein n=1 Tax=Glaciecola petra TaxID=3075602 RepID=A0ABU2ZMV1_9ALTE|nr:FlgO family outer membrane protein [Aestuariibacter sp. P117]MDT0593954.1 FlgO family outer membrane protein [Aestuariibacter sp. P117]